MGGEGDPYILASQFAFANRAKLDSFVAALEAVIERHDILRTAVLWDSMWKVGFNTASPGIISERFALAGRFSPNAI